LNDLVSGNQQLFPLEEKAEQFTWKLYRQMIKENKIDAVKRIREEMADWETVDLKTISNEDIRELGSEWISLQAVEELGISAYLRSRGWDDENIALALSHIVSRAVYPASEMKTARFIQENSSICELSGYPVNKISKDKLYDISKRLYREKSGLENYLSEKTNTLFDIEDKIILYDLTNTYFEGAKRSSKLAAFGRSKEKRNDCPLVVLALVVNVEGFIKYSSLLKGNIADCKTLVKTIEDLRTVSCSAGKRVIVVIDAGIATTENLTILKSKGYDYVCVSRSNLKKYREASGPPVMVKDNRGRLIELREVLVENGDSEYCLKVESSMKALKESSMSNSFTGRYEDELIKIAASISKKGGVKNYGKVCERIGRLKAKYRSAHKLFSIEIEKDEKDNCKEIKWELISEAVIEKREEHGVYFLKTSLGKTVDGESQEELIWTVYNCIRNIESSIRTLKTDLDLRPVYHQKDEASEAHLHLGLLAC
jgi:hypothetical protein